MIFKANDWKNNVRAGVQGGTGEVVGRHPFTADNRPEPTCFRMVGLMTLAPGSSVGVHTHHDDEEIYIFVSGRGLYTRNDGGTEEVFPGDMTLTRKGETHGIANNGDEPLVFTAVIGA